MFWYSDNSLNPLYYRHSFFHRSFKLHLIGYCVKKGNWHFNHVLEDVYFCDNCASALKSVFIFKVWKSFLFNAYIKNYKRLQHLLSSRPIVIVCNTVQTIIPALNNWMSVSASLYEHPWTTCQRKSANHINTITQIANHIWCHACLGNWVTIVLAVMYWTRLSAHLV